MIPKETYLLGVEPSPWTPRWENLMGLGEFPKESKSPLGSGIQWSFLRFLSKVWALTCLEGRQCLALSWP